MVDMHVHMREPGLTQKEDWLTGTSSAVAGGVVAVVDMPNTIPPTFTGVTLDEKEKIAREKALCDYGFYFGSDGCNLGEFEKVYDRVCGLKLYLNETTGSLRIDDEKKMDAIFRAWPRGKPILVHAEGKMLARAISLAQKNYQKLHCCHVARIADVELVAKAKQKGLPVTCEVSPHHLFLTNKDRTQLGSLAMMKPELGTEADQHALWDHIKRGTVDCIATDHAPHTLQEKESSNPPMGVPGLETAMPLLFTAVEDGKLTHDELVRLTNINPCRILGIRPANQTYVEVETGIQYQLDERTLKTKCGWSPFSGATLKTRIVRTIIRGTEVYRDGTIVATQGYGKNVI